MIGRLLTAVAVGLLATGCDRGGVEAPRPGSVTKSDSPAPVRKTYELKGVVREVDAKQKSVTIAHEAMPGFMGAMTMPFTLEKAEALEDVQPGDEVKGPIEVEFEGGKVKSYRLETLEVTNMAPVTFKLGTGPGGATLSKAKPVLKPGENVPDFRLTTQDGESIALSELEGKVVVLTFIYTRCPLPDFCPASDNAFGELARRLGEVKGRGENFRLLSVSFDPEHDTPEVLRAHAKRKGAVPPLWTFAVAAHAELSKVAEPLGLTYGPRENEIIHNLSTAVIGRDGKLVRLFPGKAAKDWTIDALTETAVGSLRASEK